VTLSTAASAEYFWPDARDEADRISATPRLIGR
jgi:hypothetical protein